jgi:hypothetical protein
MEALVAELYLVKQNVQISMVVSVVVDLLVIKGEGFNDLVRAVKFYGFIAKPSVAAKGCELLDPVGKR